MSKLIPYKGKVFERLTVLSDEPGQKVLCQCSCGSKPQLYLKQNLTKRNTKSCGCLRLENLSTRSTIHGDSKTPLHNLWWAMIARTCDPGSQAYADYGGRGIGVCEDWKEYENFKRDMGEPPKGLTLERQDNNLGYSKSNCVWATKKAQALNRRSTQWVLLQGDRLCFKDACLELGRPSSTVRLWATKHLETHQSAINHFQQLKEASL